MTPGMALSFDAVLQISLFGQMTTLEHLPLVHF